MIRILHVIALLGLWSAPGLVGEIRGQSEEQSGYSRYADERYVSYGAMVPSRRAIYNRMGQFVNYGAYGLRWSEIRDRYTQEKIDAGVGVADLSGKSSVFQENRFFNFLTVARQGYGGKYMSMALGRNLATSFTPLVLNHMTYGGLRVDYATPNHDLTFLLSRGGSLEASLIYSRLRGDQRGFEEMSPVIVGGANWKGRFGGLELGATFFRQLQSNIKSKPLSLVRGDVPYPEFRSPNLLKVRISDDSPRDLEGVAVYDAQIFLRARVDSAEVYYTSALDRAGERYVFDPSLEAVFVEGRLEQDRYLADGASEYVVINFDLQGLYAREPGLVVTEADIELELEGDYRIAMRQVYDFDLPNGSTESNRSWPFMPVGEFSLDQFRDDRGQEEMYFTVLRSKGGPRMGTGPRRVRFKHAIPTAQTFYGLNLDWLGEHLHLQGELVVNPQDFKFPTDSGQRMRRTSQAGYLTLMGKMGRAGNLGFEIFRIDPEYGGGYASRRGGLVLHTDVAERQAGVQNAVRAATQEFRTYDDNDDHDNWPDDYPGSADQLYMPTGAFNRPTFPSARPEGGVYPGLDMDGDFVLDHDKNRNAVDDYIEPFIGYASDPPEFAYGLDLNNNLVPDFRENDDLPDYPYRRDQQGLHLFYDLQERPWWLTGTRLGWYRAKEQVGGHEMSAFYARSGIQFETPSTWLVLREEIKRVRDDIADDVYRLVLVFNPGGAATRDAVALNQRYNHPNQPPPADMLPQRNSLVNTAYLETRWMPREGVEVANSFKYILNRKFAEQDRNETILGETETLHNFSLVNKASYTREVLPRLHLTGRVKHLLAKWDEGSYVPVDTIATRSYLTEVEADDGSMVQDTVAVQKSAASWSLISPELILSYALSPRTRIEFGQHGFFVPFLKGRLIDREVETGSYTQNVSLLQLTMKGAYGGYNMVSSVGLRWENIDMHSRALREDIDLSSFFVDVIFSPE